MGSKYTITACHYPYKGYCEKWRETDHLIVALFWLLVYSRMCYAVTLRKRGL